MISPIESLFRRCGLALLAACAALRLHADSAASHRLADTFQSYVDQHIIAGAVGLVETRDRVVDLETIGYADLASKRPMAPDSLFWIASMSKPVCGSAMMTLVEAGRVSVDDPVEEYLPEFKGQMYVAERDDHHMLLQLPPHPIRVRDILTHTSGLPSTGPMDSAVRDTLPLGVLVRTYALSPLDHAPETHYAYSTVGMNTAGRIVEVVSGMPYEQYLAARFFEPLGMKDTTFFPTRDQLRRLATSYQNGWKETPITALTYPLDGPNRHPIPGGGLFSTAIDMAKFCQMILNGGVADGRRYLQESSIAMMTSKQTPAALRNGYGFGWTVGLGKDEAGFGHSGAYGTYMFIDPKEGIAGVFMVQHGRDWAGTQQPQAWRAFTRAAYDVIAPGLATDANISAH